MKKIFLLLVLLLSQINMQSFVQAATTSLRNRVIKKFPKRPGAFISEKTYKMLTKAEKFLTDGKEKEGLEILEKLDSGTQNKPKENAQVKLRLTYIYANKGQFDKSIKLLNDALKTETLSEAQTLSVFGALAQFYTNKKDYKKSNEYLLEHLSYVKNPSYFIYVLFAQNNYFLEDFPPALEAIELAVELNPKEINESVYQLKFTLEYSMKKYNESLKTLKILASKFPERDIYWKQIMGVSLQIEDYSQGLIFAQLNEKLDFLKSENEKMNLASLLVMNGIPYMGGEVASKINPSLKSMELAGNAYYSAKEYEKAIEYYGKAAKFDETGKNLSIVAQIYLDIFNYDKAIDYFEKSLKKGKLRKEVDVLMNLAVCLHATKKIQKAMQTIDKVLKIEPENVSAQKWLSFLQKEKNQES